MRNFFCQFRGRLWIIPALAGLLGVLRWSGANHGPVRVLDIPGKLLKVQDGRLVYEKKMRGADPVLVVQPARGGPVRSFQLPAGHTVRGAEVTATHLVYLTSANLQGRREFDSPPVPGSPRSQMDLDHELHRIPWRQGNSDVVRFKGGFGATLTGQGCFWWGPRQGRARPLQYLPLMGGESRTVGGGEGMMMATGASGGHVVLSSPSHGRNLKTSVQTQGLSPLVEFAGLYPGASSRVTLGDRRYWVEHVQPQTGDEPHPDRIVSSLANGRDQKTVFEAQNRTIQFGQLLAKGEELFVVLSESRADRARGGREVRMNTLCRLRPNDDADPQRICQIPGENPTCYLDGDYVYIAAQETRENWWDWSADGLVPRIVTSWYRFRIPKN